MANPLAGISGGVNAPGKKRAPTFPRGLDEHFATPSLAGISGHVTAPSPKPSFNLGGVSGHALAPQIKAPPLKGVSGGSLGGISGNAMAGQGQKFITLKLGGKPASPIQIEHALQAQTRAGNIRLGLPKGTPAIASPPAHALSSKEMAKAQQAQIASVGPSKNLLGAATAPFHLNVGKTVENIPGSLQRTIVNTIPGLVKTGEAGVEAIKGHPGNLEKIGKGIGEMVAHPGKAIEQEPVPSLLMAAGAVGGAGRAAGLLARSGAVGEKAARAASLERAPMTIYGKPRFTVDNAGVATDQVGAGLHDTNPLLIPRKYSPDIIHKGAQVAVERLREARGQNPNLATGEQANRYIYGGGLFGQHVMKPLQGMIKPGLVDIEAAKGERMRRMYAKGAGEYLNQIKPRHGAEAVPLAVEGVLRRPDTVEGDLAKELDRLKGAHGGLGNKAERKANEKNQQQVEALQKDKGFLANRHEAFAAAKDYADWSRPYEERLVELGLLEPDQLNARNVPFALAHGYADKYNLAPGHDPLVGQIAGIDQTIRETKRQLDEAKAVRGHVEGEQKVGRQPYQLRSEKSATSTATRAEKARITREGFNTEERYQRHTARGEVQRLREHLVDLREKKQQMEWDLEHNKGYGATKPNGELWPQLEKNGVAVRHEGPGGLNEAVTRELGDRRLGFITHKETSYSQAQHARLGYAPASDRNLRTGESFSRGIYARNYNALRVQAYKNMNKIVGQESRNNVLQRFGIGRLHQDKVDAAIKKFEDMPEGERLRGAPGKGMGKLQGVALGSKKVLERGNVAPRMLGPMTEDFMGPSDRSIAEAADHPTHTLLHEKTLERINEHDWLNSNRAVAKAMQWYTNKWRSAALYTSPRWMLGNPQEHAIRMAFAGMNPFAIFGSHLAGTSRAIKLGNALLDHWATIASDTSRTNQVRFAARAFKADYEAGTHYGSIMMNEVRREAKDILGRDLRDAFAESTPLSVLIKDWSAYKTFIGTRMDNIERRTKAAMLGKAALREQQKFTSDWRDLITLQDKAVKAYAEQKLDPNQAATLAERIMDMAGNWSTLTPAVRKAVQSWSPFGLWWLNSMKFVFKTLPKDHPMKTAALAAMIAGTGANKEAEEGTIAKYLEGGIKLTLPYLGDVTLQQTYYSPMGIAIEPGNTAAGMAFPQLDESMMLARGLEPLSHKQIPGIQPAEQIAQIGSGLAIGATPFGRQVQQILRSGGKPEYASMNPVATKPGSQRPLPKVLLKMIAPGRLTLPSVSEEGRGGKGELRATPLKASELKASRSLKATQLK